MGWEWEAEFSRSRRLIMGAKPRARWEVRSRSPGHPEYDPFPWWKSEAQDKTCPCPPVSPAQLGTLAAPRGWERPWKPKT